MSELIAETVLTARLHSPPLWLSCQSRWRRIRCIMSLLGNLDLHKVRRRDSRDVTNLSFCDFKNQHRESFLQQGAAVLRPEDRSCSTQLRSVGATQRSADTYCVKTYPRYPTMCKNLHVFCEVSHMAHTYSASLYSKHKWRDLRCKYKHKSSCACFQTLYFGNPRPPSPNMPGVKEVRMSVAFFFLGPRMQCGSNESLTVSGGHRPHRHRAVGFAARSRWRLLWRLWQERMWGARDPEDLRDSQHNKGHIDSFFWDKT